METRIGLKKNLKFFFQSLIDSFLPNQFQLSYFLYSRKYWFLGEQLTKYTSKKMEKLWHHYSSVKISDKKQWGFPQLTCAKQAEMIGHANKCYS